MSKKKPIKKIFESASIESADVNDPLTEAAQADAASEETSLETNSPEEVTEASGEDSLIPEQEEAGTAESGPVDVDSAEPPQENAEEETSTDDLLDDVRRSLIEAESDQQKKGSKWWRRLGRKEKKAEPEETPTPVEIDLPSTLVSAEAVETEQLNNEVEEEIDQIDDLIDLLKAESEETAVEATVSPEAEPASEPEPEIDFDELKKQAFRQRAEGEEPEPFTDVRSIALEGGEEVLVEVDTKAPDPLNERLSAFENALRPYRQYIYIALAILGVGMAVVASLIIFNVYQGSRPEPVKEVSNLPYPTGVSLPGGWSFQLGQGSVENGEWNPRGPEWLEGTEVCRWVALPWSLQLEAVIRTLHPKDQINLVMSNNDSLVYQVDSVKQFTPEELQKVDSNSPCLLIILIQPDVEKRWVLTALP
jgi:hypothetical protein